MKAVLFLSILAAFLTFYMETSKEAGIISFVLFVIIIFTTIYQRVKRYDRTWYNGRAVAESLKTRTWRFVMRAEPYYDNSNINNVKHFFIADIREIFDQNRELSAELIGDWEMDDTITQSMLEIRAMDYKERLNYYIKYRINEQRLWYYKKAKYNKNIGKYWFYGLVCFYFLILVFTLLSIAYDLYFLPTSAMIVTGSSILTWTQLKKFQDLATSYSLTAHEIGIVKEASYRVDSEFELSRFVMDAENAFSREHTQWVARKDN